MATIKNRNIASVAWSDHIIFGEGDGRLDTVPALRRRMRRWKADFGAQIIHWRCTRDRINGKFFQGRGYRHFVKSRFQAIQWDDFKEAPKCAHDLGMRIFLYVALFDEGWPLLPKKVREVSYHNKESLSKSNFLLAVGAPRGNILGPPLGNSTLQWESWVKKGIVDHLIIDQNSSQCPSMWHHLWPMHRGYGYLQKCPRYPLFSQSDDSLNLQSCLGWV